LNKTRTVNTLKTEFNKGLHNWQCKKLIPIESMDYVILNLLKKCFVVEIDGHMYDIAFGKNEESGEIGYSWSSSPSPHLMSFEIVEKAFRVGKWFVVEK